MTKNLNNNNQIILYKTDKGIPDLEVKVKGESVWLNLNQIGDLFGRDKSVISRHINNIYKTRELFKKETVAKFATVQIEGRKLVKRKIEYFNLDMIILWVTGLIQREALSLEFGQLRF